LKAAVLRQSLRLVDVLLEAGADPDIHGESLDPHMEGEF
jgi:hypothetical protein